MGLVVAGLDFGVAAASGRSRVSWIDFGLTVRCICLVRASILT